MDKAQIIELYERADRYQDAMVAWLIYRKACEADRDGALRPYGWETVQRMDANATGWHEANGMNPDAYASAEQRAGQIIAEVALHETMTVEEVANTYGKAASTVRGSIHQGYIPARKSGKNWLICRADAEARWGGRDS